MNLKRGGDDPGGCRLAELLRRCSSLAEGKKLHTKLSEAGLGGNVFIQNLIVQMYARCGSLGEARDVFDWMPSRNVYSWTIMVTAYARNDQLLEARRVFDAMPGGVRGVVPWNTIISGYSQAGLGDESLRLLRLMDLEGVPANDITFMSLLAGCSELQLGVKLHGIIESSRFLPDVRVSTALVDMYGRCGELESSRLVFEGIRNKNVVSWNVMIAACGRNGLHGEAIRLFRLMSRDGVRADDVSFTSALDSCAGCGDLSSGRLLHRCVDESGMGGLLPVATSLLNMYGSCGEVERAERVFDRVESSDMILWTSLLMAYGKNKRGREAFRVFQRMELEGFDLDEACFVGTLNACACVSAGAEGKVVHRCLAEDTRLMETSVQAGNAVVHLYGECGELAIAGEVFWGLAARDLVSWNTIINCYAQNGGFEEVVEFFRGMALAGVEANAVTFVGVLSACSHAGKLGDALCYFACMERDYGVEAVEDHLACVVDLLGRVGQLREAEGLTSSSQRVEEVGCFALLSACVLHGRFDALATAAEEMLKLDPQNSAAFVLLSNANRFN